MAELPREFLSRLKTVAGASNVVTDPAERFVYGADNSRKHRTPDVVAFATDTEQTARIVTLCYEHGVPLTSRGRGTGTTGGAVPLQGGLVLSLERLTRLLKFDPANRFIEVEAGMSNQAVQDKASDAKLFWPPDPTSSAYCTVGGNVALNAAGPRAVKYGATRENVLGLTAVTGTGAIIHTGGITTKNAVGYDFTRLLIGSEGTLAVVTQAILKLTPAPVSRRTLQATYRDIASATAAVVAIMNQPVTPCALEFMDRASIGMIRDYSKINLPSEAGALLIIEVDGDEATLNNSVKALEHAAQNDGLLDIQTAATLEATQALWAMRKALSPALRNLAPNKLNEDIVVPVSRIPELVESLDAIGREYRIPIVNFGHAGNGNIHVNLLYDTQDPEQEKNALPCLSRVFDLVISLGGTLSGEHGIGLAKRDYVNRAIDAPTLALMHSVKREFDPKGILNPGKIFSPV